MNKSNNKANSIYDSSFEILIDMMMMLVIDAKVDAFADSFLVVHPPSLSLSSTYKKFIFYKINNFSLILFHLFFLCLFEKKII